MNTEQLRYFELAYTCKNFSVAARKVPMSPQGFAKAIHALEKELDVPLFENDEVSGLPVPTAFADEFAEYVTVARNNRRLLQEAFDRIRGEHRSRVRVGCSLGVIGMMGPKFLQGFSERHPDVEVDYWEARDAQIEADLRDGACDLALVVGPYQSGAVVREFYRCPVYYWVRSDDPLARKPRLEPSDFAGRNVAIPGEGFHCYEILLRTMAENGVKLGNVFQMSEIFQLYEFADSGEGLGFSVRHLVELPIFKRDASVVAVPMAGVGWTVGLERLETHMPGDAERKFWDWCVEYAEQLPRDSGMYW